MHPCGHLRANYKSGRRRRLHTQRYTRTCMAVAVKANVVGFHYDEQYNTIHSGWGQNKTKTLLSEEVHGVTNGKVVIRLQVNMRKILARSG